MADDNFDITPHKEIEKLKKALAGLKEEDANAQDLKDSIDKLTITMATLIEILSNAAQDMKAEGKTVDLNERKFDALLKQNDNLLRQNEQIAKGIVMMHHLQKEQFPRIVDAVKDHEPRPRPVLRRPMPQRQYNPQPSSSTFLTPPPILGPENMQLPDIEEPKKKNFFRARP